MTTVAFIGLGVMGLPMARNLVSAGFDVVGVNRSPGPRERLVAAGGRASDDVAAAVAGADAVITMLPDTPDVEGVMRGGVFAAARAEALVIDMSSIAPAASRVLAAEAAERDLRMLDAPVSGGEAGAIEGTLSIMVGGDAETIDAARPLLEALGTTIVHVGGSGSGQTVKAANQLIVAGTLQLVAEALTFLDAQHVDLAAAVDVLRGGLAGSTVLDRKATTMMAHDFTPGFRAELHRKDLGILLAAAAESRVPLPIGGLVTQLMEAVVAQGDGALDHSALLLAEERLAGREHSSSRAA